MVIDAMKDKVIATEYAGGADTVEYVFGVIVAVGLGAALLLFQTLLSNTIRNTANAVDNTFTKLTANHA